MEEVIADRYRLGRPLGAGGMGRVVQATDVRLGREVAVKLVDAHGAEATTRERFVREARSAARLTDPRVLAVYDVGEDDGTLYLVMELFDGPSLAEVLRERGPLDAPEAIHIADQILAALTSAHESGIVHRDVKPSNVLIAGADVKLADFGIASTIDDLTATLTSPGQIIGTVRYLAPERGAGQPATPASDLYAVGIVLYEMLTGNPPFSGDTPVATMIAHQQAAVPDVAREHPSVSPALAAVVARALAKRPEDRYSSAAAMSEALRLADATQQQTSRVAVPTATLPAEMIASAPAAAAPPSAAPRRRGPVLVLLAIMGAAAVGALAWIVATDDDPPPTDAVAPTPTTVAAAPQTTTAPATTATTPTTTPPRTATTTSDASTIPAFISSYSAQSGNYGEKLPDLLDKMGYVSEQSGAKRAEEVDKLVEELSKWSREGELDSQVAAAAIRVLQANRG